MCFWDTKHVGIFLQIVYEFPKFKCSLLWTYFVPRWDLWNLQTEPERQLYVMHVQGIDDDNNENNVTLSACPGEQ